MAADRRSHSKVDKLPQELREAINDAIVNKKMTYKDITRLINEQGHAISQKSVERYGKNFLTKLDRISETREKAQAIIERSQDKKLDMTEATSIVATELLMNTMLNAREEGGEIDKLTLSAMRTLAALERSAVSREKLRFEYDKGVKKAIAAVKAELSEELKQHPDVLGRIAEILNQVEDELRQ